MVCINGPRQYTNQRLGLTIEVPDSWSALIEDDAEASAETYLEAAMATSQTGRLIGEAYMRSRQYAKRLLRITPSPIPFPSLTLEEAFLPGEYSSTATLDEIVDLQIAEARDIDGVVNVEQGMPIKIAGIRFLTIDLATSDPKLLARTYVAHRQTGLLSIKLVGLDEQMLDLFLPVIDKISFTN